MKWKKLISNNALDLMIVAVLAGACGCNAIMGSLMAPAAPVPSVSGRWQGRIVPVSVRSYPGKAYDALALELIDGPRVSDMRPQPEGGVDEPRGGGTKPLLARTKDWESCRLVDPSLLREGQVVQLRGRMTFASAYVDRDRDSVGVSREKWGDYPAAEHVILVEGDIKVMP